MTDDDLLDSYWMRERLDTGDHGAILSRAASDPGFLTRRDVEGDTALSVAVQADCVETTHRLLQLGADPNGPQGDDYTCLMNVVERGAPNMARIARLLVEFGADVDEHGIHAWTALHHAALGKPGGVRLMLELGADVEARDEYDDTPLMLAVSEGAIKNVARLLEAGADVNAITTLGETAYDQLGERGAAGRDAVAAMLRSAGARPGEDIEREQPPDPAP